MNFRFPWQARREIAELSETLGTLAAHAELRGERGLADAVRKATLIVAAMPADERGRLLWECGQDPSRGAALLGDDAAAQVAGVARDGADAVLAASRSRLPADLVRLLDLPDVTLDEVLDLHRRFGIVTAADLAAAVTLAGREGSDRETQARHERLLALGPRLRSGRTRIPLGRAVGLADEMRALVAEVLPGEPAPEPTGSVRRFEPTVGDTSLLMATPTPPSTLSRIAAALGPARVAHAGDRAVTALVRDEQVTLHAVTPDTHAVVSVWHTGSALHVAQLQARARKLGWRLEPTGFVVRGASGPESVVSEQALYEALGLQYVPPELRHGLDELTRAEKGGLPTPVEIADIRGDLHTHTLWSDGRDSVTAIVRAARALGYEYLAITDHSQSAAASRVLTRERLATQREEVDRARAAVPGIAVLHGVEVDILPDGSLDFPDNVLAGLDIVLASLHDAAGQGPDALLARYVSAMRHPLVNVITHPANRLAGRHEGYPLDFGELFRVAVATGTALEVDGGPAHLDMDGHLARRAVEAGVTIAVDSDAHNALRLGRQMRLGVGTARRGGVEARHVLNTRPLAEVQAFLSRKRRGGAATLEGGQEGLR